MKQMKVTWYSEPWGPDVDPQNQSAMLPANISVRTTGDTLVFYRRSAGEQVELIIPEARLISAVLVEVEG